MMQEGARHSLGAETGGLPVKLMLPPDNISGWRGKRKATCIVCANARTAPSVGGVCTRAGCRRGARRAPLKLRLEGSRIDGCLEALGSEEDMYGGRSIAQTHTLQRGIWEEKSRSLPQRGQTPQGR
jgi:hypothetical protein